jgi:TPR repeat protein
MARLKPLLVGCGLLGLAAGGGAYYWWGASAVQARWQGARAALEREDWPEVERLARELVESGATDEAAVVRGGAYLRRGRAGVDRVARAGNALAAADGLHALLGGAALADGAPAGPAAALRLLVLRRGGPDPDGRLARGRHQLREEAAQDLRRAVGLGRQVAPGRPRAADAAAVVGECYLCLRELGEPVELAEAVEPLRQAVARDPDHLAARRGLAGLYL